MEDTNRQAGHEVRDVDTRAVTRSGVILALVIVGAFVASWFVFDWLRKEEVRESPLPSPLARTAGERLPPEPRLQTAPVADLNQLRAAENVELNTYAWADQKDGMVRIPVSLAIDLVSGRELPHWVAAKPRGGSK